MVFMRRNFQLSPFAAERYSLVLIRFCLTCFCGGGTLVELLTVLEAHTVHHKVVE